MKSTSAKPAKATRFPIRGSKAKGPISKGVVKAAMPKQGAAGFPAQQSDSYRTMKPPMNLKGGSKGLKPVPARKKK